MSTVMGAARGGFWERDIEIGPWRMTRKVPHREGRERHGILENNVDNGTEVLVN